MKSILLQVLACHAAHVDDSQAFQRQGTTSQFGVCNSEIQANIPCFPADLEVRSIAATYMQAFKEYTIFRTPLINLKKELSVVKALSMWSGTPFTRIIKEDLPFCISCWNPYGQLKISYLQPRVNIIWYDLNNAYFKSWTVFPEVSKCH